jgi:hypothetical protein
MVLALSAIMVAPACMPPMPGGGADPAAAGGVEPGGTAAPPPLGVPDWLASMEDWADRNCACTDMACMMRTGSPKDMDIPASTAEAIRMKPLQDRYTAASLRGGACRKKIMQSGQ